MSPGPGPGPVKPRLCFIDDDAAFEIPLFLEAFGERFDVVAGVTLEDCAARIEERGDWAPELFVLDLYFPAGAADERAIAALAESPLSLPRDGAGLRQAHANHLAAKARLAAVLAAWRQGPEGGLALAAGVRERYPGTPMVFYSRKATPEDALRCLAEDGVFAVIAKPSGATDRESELKAIEQGAEIGARFSEVIETSSAPAWGEVRAAARRLTAAVGLSPGSFS